MSVQVRINDPRLSMVIYKTIARKTTVGGASVASRYEFFSIDPRSGDRGGRIDLTALMGDDCGVRTTKNIRDPAGGFSITLVDQPFDFGGTLDTLYAALEPMDLIEIRMSAQGSPGIVMRGFISEIARREDMGQDGKPRRRIEISGQDYGKLWQIVQVYPLAKRFLDPAGMLATYKLFERFNIDSPTTLQSDEFVRELVQGALKDAIEKVVPDIIGAPPRAIAIDGIQVHGQNVSVPGLSAYNTGTLYDLMRSYCDVGVWNELYLEDLEDRVRVVFRPYPAFDAESGELIQPMDVPADSATIDGNEIRSLSVRRSDVDVANFYYVNCPTFDLERIPQSNIFQFQLEGPTCDFRDYPNSSNALYGDREMRQDVATWPADLSVGISGQPQAEQTRDEGSFTNFLRLKRLQMARMNKDNVVYEHGTLRINGRPDIRAGMFITVDRGGQQWSAYVTCVDHEFDVLSSFTTTLHFERGTGFISRIGAAAKGAPFYTETQQS